MMSPNKSKKGAVAIRDSSPEPGPSSSKRAKKSKMSSDDDEDAVPKSKKAPSKFVSKSKRSPGFAAHNKPAELFRKDLISAMKLPDSEPLQEGSYFLISDPWRQEWEKGVQVPVNMKEIMQTDVREIREKSKTGDFKIPHKLLHERVDTVYKKGMHELTGMQQLSEQLVRYDLDDLDVCWLDEVNFTRREMGLTQINEWNMERVVEALENQCHEKMTAVMKTEEGMGIEYDEDIVCDVCCSPDSEDTNEMVFCDGCDVCIHQACYGIQSIPEGSWLCRTCALGIKPNCILCPKVGGAMKSTRSGTKWAHVSCALWIPEVSIEIPEKMEPITKISNIPPSRWALLCCLCKERVGACIQCSVKTCKTAFHVTCGFSNGLEMKTVLDETDERDGVKLKAFCPKHTKKRERGHSESDVDSPRKEGPPTPKKEMTQQERENLRAQKLKGLEEDFHSLVDVSEISHSLQLDREIVDLIHVYWKLKRKCNWDKPLLTPKTEEADILEKQQEDSLVARMKMFVHLRQDLERVRNLCYMIGKREKTKRQFFRSKEYVFTSMVRVLLDKSLHLSNADVDDIVHNYHFDSIYDDYGLSVQHLPPEPSQDEGLPSEMEMKEEKVDSVWGEEEEEEEEKGDTVDSQQEMEAALEQVAKEKLAEEPSVVEEEEMEEDPNEALPPGERWSGEFVRSGFFMRRRPKKWMKGAMAGKAKKKKLPSALPSPEITAPPICVKPEKTPLEDDNVFTSNDESDEDKEKLAAVVKAIVDRSDDDSDFPQPLLPRLVVKSPKSKPLTLHRHRHKRRHRGRKPWHMRESYHQDLQLTSSEDEDMKVEPILGRRKESLVPQPAVEEMEIVDVVACDDNLTTPQEPAIVKSEGDGAVSDFKFFQSSDAAGSECHSRDTDDTRTASVGSKTKKTERSVQELFDLVRRESEQAKSLQCSERTKPDSDQAESLKSVDTKVQSEQAKESESVKTSDTVKPDVDLAFNLSIGDNSHIKPDNSKTQPHSKRSDHRRSNKSKSKSGCKEKKNTHFDNTYSKEGKRKYDDTQKKHEKHEDKRKEREARHKDHESLSSSRRSRRERKKSRQGNVVDSNTLGYTPTSSLTDGLNRDKDKSEACQTMDTSEDPRTSQSASAPKLSDILDLNSVQKFNHEERMDSADTKSAQKLTMSEETRKIREIIHSGADSLFQTSSGWKEVDGQRTKKGKVSDKVKHIEKETAEPFKGLVITPGSRRRSSSSGLPNIFERMERSTSSSSGHSSERSNIFESMERHRREGSLDLGLKDPNMQLSEPLKRQSSMDWASEADFHLNTCDEASKPKLSTDHWFSAASFTKSSHVVEDVKTSGRLDSPPDPSLDKSFETDDVKCDADEVSQSAVESAESQPQSSDTYEQSGKMSDSPCQTSDNTFGVISGECTNGPGEDGLCASENVSSSPCEEVLGDNTGMPFMPEQDVPCLSKVDAGKTPDDSVPCSPSQAAPCLPNEVISSLPSENVSFSSSGEAACPPSEQDPCLSGKDVNIPSLSVEDVPLLSTEQLPHLPEDENEDLYIVDDDMNGVEDNPVESEQMKGVGSNLQQGNDDRVNGSESDLQTKEENGVDMDVQAETVATKVMENDLHEEMEGVNSVDNATQLGTEEVDNVENKMQVEPEGVNHVENDTPVKTEEADGGESGLHVELDEIKEDEKVTTGPNIISPVSNELEGSIAVTPPAICENSKVITPSCRTVETVPSSDSLKVITPSCRTVETVASSDSSPQKRVEVLKIRSSQIIEVSSRQHRERSNKMEDNKGVIQADSVSLKNNCQAEEVSHRPNALKTKEKLRRRSSIRMEEKLESTESSGACVRQRRKSSHEARLKLSKVLALPDSSSDEDFEPTQPMMTFPRRQRHDRHSKKLERRHRGRNMSSEELSEGEESEEEDAAERHRMERKRSRPWDNREQPLQKDCVPKSASRAYTESLQPELNKLLKPSDLIVEDELVKRVEDSFLRRYRYNHRHSRINGALDDKQKEQKLTQVGRDSKKRPKLMFSKDSSKWLRSSGDGEVPLTKHMSRTRVLNEISPERSVNFQTNLFGAHYSPRGSLSGYKIPKKSGGPSAVPPIPSAPQTVSPSSAGPFSGGAEFSSFKSLAAAGPQHLPCPAGEETPLRKTQTVPDGASDIEASSTLGSSDLVEGCPASRNSRQDYRCGSPASDTSAVMVVAAPRSESRESTPRRCTRSQLVEELAENSPAPHMAGASRMKLRDSWLKASNFPS